ncbi:RAD50 [Candida pseudojiufengensis]|uniref:RAD50 n=1 Tax=Candida pseudojiufengensis TaxID=497109 RepID=UPI002224D89E|nr:RAD50 [Candida pseudojiufengensis]KAI5959318.1 RAD50 [Candida pseudojiufengensis]
MNSNTEISKLEYDLDEYFKKSKARNKQSELKSKLTFFNSFCYTSKVIDGDVDDYKQNLQDLDDNYENVTEDVNTSEITKNYGQSALKNHVSIKFIEELQQGFDDSKIEEVKLESKKLAKNLMIIK